MTSASVMIAEIDMSRAENEEARAQASAEEGRRNNAIEMKRNAEQQRRGMTTILASLRSIMFNTLDIFRLVHHLTLCE